MNPELAEIKEMLTRLLYLMGDGPVKLPSEVKREADVIYLKLEERKRKRSHGGAVNKSK